MKSVYVEHSFKMPVSLGRYIIEAILVLIGIISIVISPYFLPILSLGAFSFFIAYLLFRNNKTEMEYTLIDDDLYIDRIIGSRKRKRIYHENLQYMEVFSKNDKDLFLKYKHEKIKIKRYIATHENSYALIIKNRNYSTCLLLNVNDEFILAMKSRFPHKVKL